MSPPPIQNSAEEQAFLEGLLSDSNFWDAVPSPDPIKSNKENTLSSSSSSLTTRPVPPSPQSQRLKSPLKVSVNAADLDMAALFEGAEDWDMDAPLEISPVKPQKTKVNNGYTREPCTRCKVEVVTDVEDDSSGDHKHLTVRISKSDERRTVILRDDPRFTDIHPGHTINIIGHFLNSTTITINAKSNLLILHPDILLTPSTLASAPQCTRKPLLSSLVRSTTFASHDTPAMVWGTMLHEVMQTCMQTGKWSETELDACIEDVVRNDLVSLVKMDIPNVEAGIKEVKARAGGLLSFAEKYLASEPKDTATLANTRSSRDTESFLAISNLLDVEEDIWSPTYGLKGKLDATVDSRIITKKKVSSSSSSPFVRAVEPPIEDIGTKPFEIKTGRPNLSMEHRAQTMLYTLLLSERYNIPVEAGLLYYTQSEEVNLVPRGWNEIRGLIRGRNEVAGFMFKRYQAHKSDNGESEIPEIEETFLPPPIDDERMCKRCFVSDTCMLYRKTVENHDPPTNPILADLYERKTSHLTINQSAFFKKWERLLSYEESDLLRFKKELWTMAADAREKKGRCFANMVMDVTFKPSKPLTHPNATTTSKIHQFTYRFVRSQAFALRWEKDSSFLNGHINVGNPIVVSVEPNLLALSRGYILELSPHHVDIGVDRSLDELAIRGRMDIPPLPAERVHFRIDKDELFSGFGKIRDNLAQLCYPGGDTKRMELVVDLREPVFSESKEGGEGKEEPLLSKSILAMTQHLNISQKQALRHILSAEDYALVLGMPGTGKTTIIDTVIRCLVAQGKSVLLTSYTHSAVDNVLLKFVENAPDFKILRLGNLDQIHPKVQQFTLKKNSASSVEQLEIQLMSPPVVATTCLSIDHALFSRRSFDVCIVDEASQITLPTCLGPLRYAKTFVLVGDHFQLPPLVRNPTAKKAGLDVSLFRRLSEAHPQSVIDLAYQYRMNEDIMELSNKLIYSNRLRCGSVEVAKRSLSVPNMSRFFSDILHTEQTTCNLNECWLSKLVSPTCKVMFVDTDLIPAQDCCVGDLVQNEVEADLVYQLTEALLASGVEEEQIGVISLYRQQIKILNQKLQMRKKVEILTADKSQGRDKDCVIISLVRSNEGGLVGDLMKDWRRMNVSFTRARSKLVIFGSRQTLKTEPLLSEFFDLVESRGWIMKLPPRGHLLHASQLGMQNKRSMVGGDHEDEIALGRGKPFSSEVMQTPRKKSKTIYYSPGKIPNRPVVSPSPHSLLKGRPVLTDLVRDSL